MMTTPNFGLRDADLTRGLDAGLADLLLQLGRPGARLRQLADGMVLESSATAARRPVNRDALAAAAARGHLAPAEVAAGTGSDVAVLVLSAAGQDALRQLLMTGARAQPARTRRRKRLQAGDETAQAAPLSQRPISRRSAVEQLAQRTDGRGMPLLEPQHVAAAQRFALDFLKSGIQPRVTARWSADAIPERRRRGAPGAGAEMGVAQSAAQERVRAALAALGGTLADLVLDICGFDLTLETVEAERGWPKRAGRIMLKGALEQLALHYGMVVVPRRGRAGVQQWGDGAYRPSSVGRHAR